MLENPANYFSDFPSDPEVGGNIGLMQAVTEKSGCQVLLDLHNLHCNAVNHGFDPFMAIDRMPLTRVVEIHIAGGRGGTVSGWMLMTGVCRNAYASC